MKKLLLLGTLMIGAFAVGGCSSPCDELKKKCDACTSGAQKDACNQTVSSYKALPGGDTSCQAVLDAHSYDNCETN